MSKKKCADLIYCDANGTTKICGPAKKTYLNWIECYNPATSSKFAKPAKALMDSARDSILAHCNVNTAKYTAVFTSGASESNCFIIRACVKAYKRKLLERDSEFKPHIILSAVEHNASIECAEDLKECGEADVTYVEPTIYGNILPQDVKEAIRPNTCLISIMYANNEIPVINNIKEIGEIAHKHSIPLHTDAVQIFGKSRINLEDENIDALSATAHKFYGPKGVGVIIVNNLLIEGYNLRGEINGTQQGGLRGGTENVPAVASMMEALKHTFTHRKAKNVKLYSLRTRLLERLAESYPIVPYMNYLSEDSHKYQSSKKAEPRQNVELINLGPPEDKKAFILPNTVLLAICKNKGKPFCNIELKEFLDKHNIVISIGSACNTASSKASHVLDAIGGPPIVKRGVVRISFGDDNTLAEVEKVCKYIVLGIQDQCKDLKKLE
jgi:cysteine desulfurase